MHGLPVNRSGAKKAVDRGPSMFAWPLRASARTPPPGDCAGLAHSFCAVSCHLLTEIDVLDWLPDASTATAVNVWLPTDALRVFQLYDKPDPVALATSLPSR